MGGHVLTSGTHTYKHRVTKHNEADHLNIRTRLNLRCLEMFVLGELVHHNGHVPLSTCLNAANWKTWWTVDVWQRVARDSNLGEAVRKVPETSACAVSWWGGSSLWKWLQQPVFYIWTFATGQSWNVFEGLGIDVGSHKDSPTEDTRARAAIVIINHHQPRKTLVPLIHCIKILPAPNGAEAWGRPTPTWTYAGRCQQGRHLLNTACGPSTMEGPEGL